MPWLCCVVLRCAVLSVLCEVVYQSAPQCYLRIGGPGPRWALQVDEEIERMRRIVKEDRRNLDRALEQLRREG